jgi:hypothetical protein
MTTTTPARRWLRHRLTARWAGLDFSLELPETWQLHAPDAPEDIDFDAEPARLVTLLTATSDDRALSLEVAARPSVMVTGRR